jgi:membrane associated rhomboid family serine protease
MSFTLILLAITGLVSYMAFNDKNLESKLILWPRKMDNPAEYYRFLTSGFIHSDWNHLIFNMLTLYFFGKAAEENLGIGIMVVVLYLSGIVIAGIPSFIKNRNNSYYRSLGASGGVSSVVFFFIYFFPWNKIYFFFIIGMPSIIFAIAYLVYSAFMSKRGGDNINHDAHIWGSVYGFLFAIIYDPTHGVSFLDNIMHPY